MKAYSITAWENEKGNVIKLEYAESKEQAEEQYKEKYPNNEISSIKIDRH